MVGREAQRPRLRRVDGQLLSCAEENVGREGGCNVTCSEQSGRCRSFDRGVPG